MRLLSITMLAVLVGLGCTSVQAKSKSKPDFKPTWESLSENPIPEWMKDAKFGVYTHWGVFSVPAHGGPDYIKNLYGDPAYDAIVSELKQELQRLRGHYHDLE